MVSGGSPCHGKTERGFVVWMWWGYGFLRAPEVRQGLLPLGVVPAPLQTSETSNSSAQEHLFPLLRCHPLLCCSCIISHLRCLCRAAATLLLLWCLVRLGLWGAAKPQWCHHTNQCRRKVVLETQDSVESNGKAEKHTLVGHAVRRRIFDFTGRKEEGWTITAIFQRKDAPGTVFPKVQKWGWSRGVGVHIFEVVVVEERGLDAWRQGKHEGMELVGGGKSWKGWRTAQV